MITHCTGRNTIGFPANCKTRREALGHGHYGWAIWGVVFLLGMAGGILLEWRAAKKDAK